MKILIADDDPVSCRLMQRTLQKSGYEVIVASDGRMASKELSRNDGPKLALVDWMMPELDGPGVCREVRNRSDQNYVYIVLLTAKQSNEDIVEGLEAGADDYLTKPCNLAELNARLLTGRRILRLEESLVEARESMRFRATHDGLTKLFNRTAALSRLQQMIHSAAQEKVPISVLLCDIDHFKKINDTYGHAAGDAVLEQVAHRLLDAAADTDCVGRYGGEEFLVVLKDCGPEALAERAEQIRSNMADQKFKITTGLLEVTLSFGGISVVGTAGVVSTDQLVASADAALYEAKADGRNCVRFSSLPSQEHEEIGRLDRSLTESGTVVLRRRAGDFMMKHQSEAQSFQQIASDLEPKVPLLVAVQ